MPAPPGMSQEEYLILKKRQKEKIDMEAAKKVYKKKYDPSTVAEEIDTDTLEQTWMKDGNWGPNWAKVEFVSSAWLDRGCPKCLKLVDPDESTWIGFTSVEFKDQWIWS